MSSAIVPILAALMLTPQPAVSIPVQPAVGVYTGPADTAEHDRFSAWLGTEAHYALDFVDDSQGWANIAKHSDWLIDPWSSWSEAKAHSRMVISVPMLNRASSGQLAEGVGGAFDAHFRRLAREIVDKGLGAAIIRLGWEANGDWFAWKASADPGLWKQYFRRIVGIFRSVQPKVAGQRRQDFEFLLTYNVGASGTQIKFDTIYPGDDVVDILGMDVFDHKYRDDASPPEARWDELRHQEMGLEDFKAFAARRGKPMSFPEWGLAQKDFDDNGGAGDNPYFIDRMADWLSANAEDVRFHSYFNHLSGWTGDHRLASYANARARFKARFGLPVPPADTKSPTVALTSPRDGAGVRANLRVAASAGDARGVAGVQFLLNGRNLGTEDRYAPFEASWDTRKEPDGTYAITAVARDVADNITTSATRVVVVRNR